MEVQHQQKSPQNHEAVVQGAQQKQPQENISDGEKEHQDQQDDNLVNKDKQEKIEKFNSGSDQNSKEDDKGKSIRKGSSDSIRESHQDNDNSQPLTGGGKKCFNKLCSYKKIYKKIRSKVQPQRYRFLCRNCYQNYVNNSFCEFCQQIYSNYQNEEEDLNKWVGCDKCERWNHIQCERKYRDKNFQINSNSHYECLACSRKNGNKSIVPDTDPKRTINPTNKLQDRNLQYESTRNYRSKVQISKEDRMPIFNKKSQNFPCLQAFLQSYNFRVWLSQNVIRDDIETLRNLNRRPPADDDHKKIKKIKQE